MTNNVSAIVLLGDHSFQVEMSPGQLREHYELAIRAAEGSYPDKIRRVQAGIALARKDGTFTPFQCDWLDELAAKALHATLHPEAASDE